MEANFFYTYIISVPIIAFFTTIAVKAFFLWMSKTENILHVSLWSWGMPSAHSALATSITTALAIKNSIYSDEFALSFIFTVIIIYDAINIRYEAGQHAKALNDELWSNFNESLGHLPSEALVWSVLWIIVAVVLKLIW